MVNEYGTGEGSSSSGTLDQARHVAEKAKERAFEAVESNIEGTTDDLASRLESFAQKLDEIGRDQQGFEQQLVSKAAGVIRQAASNLEGKDTRQLIDDVARQVRARPGLFFAGAAALGFLGGRLARR